MQRIIIKERGKDYTEQTSHNIIVRLSDRLKALEIPFAVPRLVFNETDSYDGPVNYCNGEITFSLESIRRMNPELEDMKAKPRLSNSNTLDLYRVNDILEFLTSRALMEHVLDLNGVTYNYLDNSLGTPKTSDNAIARSLVYGLADVLTHIDIGSMHIPISSFPFGVQTRMLISTTVERYDTSHTLPHNVLVAAEQSIGFAHSTAMPIISASLFMERGPALFLDVMKKDLEAAVRKVGKEHLEELARELRQ